jgi:hypothetical protein
MHYKQELKRHTKDELLEIINSQQEQIKALQAREAAHLADNALRAKSKALKDARKETGND